MCEVRVKQREVYHDAALLGLSSEQRTFNHGPVIDCQQLCITTTHGFLTLKSQANLFFV
jgi:hypothetical protein